MLPDGWLGIDVDAYDGKAGAATLAELEAGHGPLPETVVSTSREDGVSCIRLFRVPSGREWHPNLGRDSGIDIISWYERYVICAPSVHGSGRAYQWRRGGRVLRGGPLRGSVLRRALADLPALPPAWVELCLAGGDDGRAGPMATVDADTRRWLRAYGGGAMCSYMAEMAPKAAAEMSLGAHETAAYWSLMICNAIAEGHSGGNRALRALRDDFYAEVCGRTAGRRRSPSVAAREWRTLLEGAVKRAAALPLYREDDCGELEGFRVF